MTDRLEDFALGEHAPLKGSIQKVGIVGCGSMGQEITTVVAKAGIEVIFLDQTEERIVEINAALNARLNEEINRWGLTGGEKRAILTRISGTTDYSKLKDCDLVLETVYNRSRGTNMEVRKAILKKIEAVVSTEAVIASNVSTVLISELTDELKHPERAVGLHFLTPASQVTIVEVVKGRKTNEDSQKVVKRFCKMIGKKVIELHESPGNISTRLILPLINEACEILMEGVAPMSCIDETMKRGFGLQFGPFELADKLGLDKVNKWMDNLYVEFGERKFKASPVIRRLVRDNAIGRETGRGFYIYDETGKIIGQSINNSGLQVCE
ncbi:MAG TPA: 3-hydroxybutyryl-CoA dehydrogenase [Bacteroidales bacterium]|nr:3-hydroxybutyryl-CoA dehydrogenase [Bacteroidales bacterium]